MRGFEPSSTSVPDHPVWHRLQSHCFDQDGAALNFSGRLARENGWSAAHTARVLEEYRRFCFLAVTAGHQVTPSDAVDQAWHLHLTYSRDYWEQFCPQVLGKPLHHGPTAGGAPEQERFFEQYAQTLLDYEQAFGPPPPDLWPDAARRLLDDPRARRVHPRDALVMTKTKLTGLMVLAVAVGLALGWAIFGKVGSMGLGPLDLAGGSFLAFYAVLLVSTGIASLLMPHWTRPQGRPGRIDGLDELAHLAGGTVRMAESALVRLLAVRAITQEGKDQFRTRNRGAGTTQVERSILGMAHPARWPEILRQVSDYGQMIERRLAAKGLKMDSGEVLRQRCLNALPLLAPFLFVAAKFVIEQGRDKPIGNLGVLLAITAALAIFRFGAIDRRTIAGHELLSEEGERNERIRRAPTRSELSKAVALFGTRSLVGSELSGFHQIRRDNGEGGTSGCGSDGGGGGCGGGCGGD